MVLLLATTGRPGQHHRGAVPGNKPFLPPFRSLGITTHASFVSNTSPRVLTEFVT